MANLSNINGKFVVEQTTGYVGVGTTDPSYPIEVLNASAEIALNASGGSIYRLKSDSTDFFRINKNGVGDRLVIDGSGNVGIGTGSPVSTWLNTFDPTTGNGTFKLTSEGWIVTPYLTGLAAYYPGQGARPIMWSDVNGTNIQSWDNDASDGISLRSSNGSTKLIVREDGNVGIGTTSPDIGTNPGTAILTLKNTGTNRAVLNMTSTTPGTGPYAQEAFYNGGVLKTLVQHVGDGSTDSGYIKWFTTASGGATTERMRLTSNGSIYNGSTSNTHFGYNALVSVTTADESTAFGANALGSQQEGRNTAVGFHTLQDLTTGGYNTAVGGEALENVTTGSNNTALGAFSGRGLTTGGVNTLIGGYAGYSLTTGGANTLIGHGAGDSMTDGLSNVVIGRLAYQAGSNDNNTIIGTQAGYAGNSTSAVLIGFKAGYNNTGSANTIIGNEAGFSHTSGTGCTFIGQDAGYYNTTSGANTYVGGQAGIFQTGLYNSAFGNLALFGANGASNASYNTAVGYDAGSDITSGASNTFLGTFAGNTIKTGNDNIAIGKEAMAAAGINVIQNIGIGYLTLRLALGNNNIAIGHLASYGGGTSSTSNNVVIGGSAGQGRTEGSNNVIIGVSASFAAGTGGDNTVVGKSSGDSLTSGYNNTLIGAYAGANITSGSNNTCLGAEAETPSNSSTNTIVLGNSSINSLRCQVQTISGLSDKRDKTNIKDSEYGLDLISSLKPVTFKWNQRDGQRKGLKDLGFIAQDLQKVDDEHLSFVSDEDPEKLSASYGRLIPVLVKAIQELKAEIEILKNK